MNIKVAMKPFQISLQLNKFYLSELYISDNAKIVTVSLIYNFALCLILYAIYN